MRDAQGPTEKPGHANRSRSSPGPPRTAATRAPAAVSNVLFMMNDFTDANGGTRVVPGSHLAGRHPDPEADADVETVAAEGDAGAALITDGRVWHGTGENRSEESRIGMLINFCGPQYRPQMNFTIALDPEILANASDRLKTLFGLKVWWGYGRTGNPTAQFVDPAQPALGELR